MSSKIMKVLTRDSIVDLRAVAIGDTKKVWFTPLNQLVSEFGLETIEVEATYEPGHEFKVGSGKDRTKDEANASLLRQALPELTPAQATDQRIWTTLALGDYKDYVLNRWGPAEGVDYPLNIKVFIKDTRSMMRDHAISRLWWRSHFAMQVSKSDCQEPLRLMFEYEDIPGEIAGRSILTDRRVLSQYLGQVERGLEAITPNLVAQGLTPKIYIQSLGRNLNFLGGRFQLGVLNDERLFKIFQIAHNRVLTQFSTT